MSNEASPVGGSVRRLAESVLETEKGLWQYFTYAVQRTAKSSKRESIAAVLVFGDVTKEPGVYCRVHSTCSSAHNLLSIECDCVEQMRRAQSEITRKGSGIIITLEQDGRGYGPDALQQARQRVKDLDADGYTQNDAYRELFGSTDDRDYQAAAAILLDLGVDSVTLLSENCAKAASLRSGGVEVKERLPMRTDRTDLSKYEAYHLADASTESSDVDDSSTDGADDTHLAIAD